MSLVEPSQLFYVLFGVFTVCAMPSCALTVRVTLELMEDTPIGSADSLARRKRRGFVTALGLAYPVAVFGLVVTFVAGGTLTPGALFLAFMGPASLFAAVVTARMVHARHESALWLPIGTTILAGGLLLGYVPAIGLLAIFLSLLT